jgi:hypothetical protein
MASLVLSVSLCAIVGTWYVSMGMTLNTSDQGVATNLARMTMESIKSTGFYNTAEAPTSTPTIHYYDGSCVNQDANPNSSSARYAVYITVVSSATVTGSSPTQPTDSAVRTVTIIVKLRETGTALLQYTSNLARAGL